MNRNHKRIPKTFTVQPLKQGQTAKSMATCGYCGLSWDDGISTSMTPAPAGRCPFEYYHTYVTPKHTPETRCSNCRWVHEVDSTLGTSFRGVGLCQFHATAPEMLEMLYKLLPCAEESDEFNKPSHKIGPRVLALIAKAEGK